MLLSSDESELVCLTHRNKFIFMDLKNPDNVENSVKGYNLQTPIIDYRFTEGPNIVILAADYENPLILLSNNGKFINFPKFELFGKFEYPISISDVRNNKMVVVSNKRNIVVLEFDIKVSFY